MSRRRFDALFIDFYGTISAGDRDAVEATCRRVVETYHLPMTPAAFAVRWGKQFFDILERSNHDAFQTLYQCELASLTDTLAQFGKKGDPAPFVAVRENYWTNPPLYPDAVEFLQGVNLPICCVSNADTQPLLAAMEKHGLRFDAVVTSEAVRCYKPDPAIFLHALQMVDVPPDSVIHVGDSLHSDVQGATTVGLTSVWLHRENRIHDIGECRANFTINTLNEMSPLLIG